MGSLILSGKNLASLRIIKYPDPRLRRPCEPVKDFDGSLSALAARMLELMREDKGVGLAAPQVGINLRLFVCNITGEPGDDLVIVNPELTDLTGDQVGEEGCLSIPDVTVNMHRAQECVMSARDVNGKPLRLKGADLSARCWQHETDHLNGRLIIDQMSEADKIANRKPLKKLEAEFKSKR